MTDQVWRISSLVGDVLFCCVYQRGVLMCITQATVHLVSSDPDKTSVFKVMSVIVKVNQPKFSIHGSKYGLLCKTFKPHASDATTVIKNQIQRPSKARLRRVWSTSMDNLSGLATIWLVVRPRKARIALGCYKKCVGRYVFFECALFR
jgi:hypothetical protein